VYRHTVGSQKKEVRTMEAVVAVVVGVVVSMHGMQLFGLSHPKIAGTVGAVGATAPTLRTALRSLPLLTAATSGCVASSVVVWVIYAALVAVAGLWGFDARGLGLFSAWGAIAMITQIFYIVAVSTSVAALVCGIVQAIAFAMLFVYLAIPVPGLKKATAWVMVVVGSVHGLLGSLMLAGATT
jgi:hypothetical protein